MSTLSHAVSGIFGHARGNARLVVDIGTASVSAVLAHEMIDVKNGALTHYEISHTFNQSFNLLDLSRGNFESRAWHVMNIALSQIFSDVSKTKIQPVSISMSFASLFFKEYTVKKSITREHPTHVISRREVDGYIDAYAKEIAEGKGMIMISNRMLRIGVNGYHVDDPVGYTGETIECSVQYLFISDALHAYIHELLSKLFPGILTEFYSDADVLVSLLGRTTIPLPTLILDIGGEATSCYTVFGDKSAAYHQPVYFGVRTLERRIAALLQTEIGAAESLLHRFTAGTLHEEEWEKIQPTVDIALTDWWGAVKKEVPDSNVHASIVLAGSGRDIIFFEDTVKKYAVDAFGVVTKSIVSLPSPNDRFVPQKSFAFGGDMILGGLLLIHEV